MYKYAQIFPYQTDMRLMGWTSWMGGPDGLLDAWTILKKSYPKMVTIFFVIKFRRNFDFLSLRLYKKILVITLVNLTI
jgi:hypothetical protein